MTASRSLRNRIIHAASWTMAGHVFGQLLRLASNLIMTRLLVPEMFGVMAIANVVMIGLAMMSDVGIRQHIIQSTHSDSEDFLNTAWVVQIIRGGILWVFALLISWSFIGLADYNLWPPDSVYADPILPYIIGALSFTTVINGLGSTNLAMANRNLAMNKVVKIELTAQITGIVFMIAWAYIDRTIWALVAGALISSVIVSVLSHTSLPGYKNKLCWEKESLHELLHFGKWIFLSSILGFLAINGDRLILGGLIDSSLLGIYTIAVFIVGAIQQVFNKIIGSVALPALSEVARKRPDDLIKVYYKFRLPIDGIMLLSAGFLFISGNHIIDFLYDDRYKQAGFMLEILSLSLLAERYSLAGQCFIALGKPSYIIPMIALRLPVIFILLPIMYNYYGLEAALWTIALNRFVTLPVLFYLKAKISIFKPLKEVYLTAFVFPGLLVGWVVNMLL